MNIETAIILFYKWLPHCFLPSIQQWLFFFHSHCREKRSLHRIQLLERISRRPHASPQPGIHHHEATDIAGILDVARFKTALSEQSRLLFACDGHKLVVENGTYSSEENTFSWPLYPALF